SGGIGLAFAELFARDGWHLVTAARSADKLEASAADFRKRFGVTVLPIALDLAQAGAAQALYERVARAGVHVDALVNNAGFATYGFFRDIPLEDERQEMQLNMLTLTELSKLCLEPMLARGTGRILNVASNGAFQPCPGMAVYCATKAYVLSFSEALSNELAGTGVTVTALCPGATESGFQERAKLHDSPAVQRKLPDAMSAARAGYEAMLAGKRLVIPGAGTKIGAFLPRLLPRGVVLSVARRMLAPRR
ncbi:MAG TPA: SDR family oxidoreductase, partial [Candidatus Baltobacteraceae bacterium]|nr:SDR family oxidoreductase [Candidatus Baltobacteraceae bacterium]